MLATGIAALTLALGATTTWAQGIVQGHVTAQGTNAPLAEARVLVIGTSIFTTTNAEGLYTLRNVPAGNTEVRVLRVGYVEQKKPVSVTTGQTSPLDFSLQQTVVQLEQVVTTATGEQRRTELGNTVSSINVADRAITAPIKNLGEALALQAPGVQVLPGNMTGAGSRIRIRGTSSLSLASDPIYIIDGIRMTSDQGQGIGVGGTQGSRVNDINPNDVENIEIVKGPSAATLYGTDAANGVIVITTKKGRAGAARWNLRAEQGLLKDYNDYPAQHAILGHLTTRPDSVVKCVLKDISLGTCVMDSTSVLNLFTDPSETMIKPGYRYQYGTDVSGGNDVLRYFVSGDAEREIGTVGMPDFEKTRFDTLHVGILPEWNRPNALQKANARANLSATVSPTLDLQVSSGFTKLDQRLPQVDNNVNSYFFNAMTGPGFKNPLKGVYGGFSNTLQQPLLGYASFRPGDIFQQLTSQSTQRFIGSLNANWRPLSWLQGRADVGLDLADRKDFNLCRFAQCNDFSTNRQGFALDFRQNTRNFTSNLSGTGSWVAKDWLNFKTTAGAQYVNYQRDLSLAQGATLPPGAQTPQQGTIPSTQSGTTLQKTLGLFVEEAAALHDRLFLTAAVRTDQNSAFGTNFQRVYYPKASVSWLASDEPFFPKYTWLSQFRLRASLGASGVQPGPNDASRTFSVATSNIAGTDISGLRSNQLGNSNLKPERTTEFEGGFDARFFNNRLNFEATYYSKLSKDALINQVIAPSGGTNVTSMLVNLGSVKNAGGEGLINAQLVDLKNFAWDLTVNGSHNQNKLVTLGNDPNTGKPIPPVIGTNTRQIAGYPLNGYWQRPFTYNDANHDGIITPNEVTVADSVQFLGYSQPRDEVGISNGIEILNHKLRLSALVDYKGGNSLDNREQEFLCQQTISCPGTSDPKASQFIQARTVASRYTPVTTTAGFFENDQYWKVREIAATLTMPDQWATRYLRARAASLNFAVRNVATITKFTGIDPEANFSLGNLQDNLLTQGPPRYYTFRLNLSY
jgi:TonB-linked SusC/RagA family outer membrane protein